MWLKTENTGSGERFNNEKGDISDGKSKHRRTQLR